MTTMYLPPRAPRFHADGKMLASSLVDFLWSVPLSHQNSHMKPGQRSVNVYSTAHKCISPPCMHAHTGRALGSILAFMEMLPNSRRGQLKCVTPGEERERMSRGEEPASIVTLETVLLHKFSFTICIR